MKDANDEIGDFLRDQATEGLEEVDDELAELEAELAEEAMKDMEFPDARKESKNAVQAEKKKVNKVSDEKQLEDLLEG